MVSWQRRSSVRSRRVISVTALGRSSLSFFSLFSGPPHLPAVAHRGPPRGRIGRGTHHDHLAAAPRRLAAVPRIIPTAPHLLRGEQPRAQGGVHSPGAGVDAHLLVGVGKVALDGGLGQDKCLSDLPVAHPTGDERQELDLPRRRRSRLLGSRVWCDLLHASTTVLHISGQDSMPFYILWSIPVPIHLTSGQTSP